jgi:hypothetical protein
VFRVRIAVWKGKVKNRISKPLFFLKNKQQAFNVITESAFKRFLISAFLFCV